MGRLGITASWGVERDWLAEGEHVLKPRHGAGAYTPPHRIDHVANMRSLAEAGVDRVLAIASTGSTTAALGVGTFVCPSDFIALHLGTSAFDDERGHRVPGFDADWRTEVIDSWKAKTDVALHEGGTYWQAIGPRFETPAEIRLIAAHAELVGMTIASECIVAGELGLRYACVCVVDNLANGVQGAALRTEAYEAGRAANRARLIGALETVVPALAGAPE